MAALYVQIVHRNY